MPRRSAFGNFASLVLGRGGGLIVSMVLAVYLARSLQPVAFGYFGFVQSVTTQTLQITDLGLVLVGMREAARLGHVSAELYASTVRIRVVLACLAIAAALLIGAFWPLTPATRLLLWGYTPAALAMAFSLDWAFQGIERMWVVGAQVLVRNVLYLALCVWLVRAPGQFLRLRWCYLAGWAGMLLFSYGLAWREPRIRFGARSDAALTRALWRSALPLGGFAMLVIVVTNVDFLVMGWMHAGHDVGVYYTAYKIFMALLIVAPCLTDAVLPVMTRHACDSGGLVNQWLQDLWPVLLAFSLPVPAVAWLLGRPFLRLLFGGAYTAAATPLLILCLAAPFLATEAVFFALLIAHRRERHYLGTAAVVLVIATTLDLLLIGRWPLVGAAIAQTAAQLGGWLYAYAALRAALRSSRLPAQAARVIACGAPSAILLAVLRGADAAPMLLAAASLYAALLGVTATLSRRNFAALRGPRVAQAAVAMQP